MSKPRTVIKAPRGKFAAQHAASELAVRLAAQVRQLRLRAELTQAELALRAGVTVETVARLERVLRGRISANCNPSLETMDRIGGALGVDVAVLLSRPNKGNEPEDRLAAILRGASAGTRRRVLRVAEALAREERNDAARTRGQRAR
ncbi:MAG TPA: helix-turn-helix transcriptional regulator [Polyangiaceae bacterium]|jgi:transcriptional regulator with XRE-family HTH domain